MTDHKRIEPLETRSRRTPFKPLIEEMRMLIAWLATSLRMALESMIRFGVRPPVTVFERQPGQYPDIGLVHRELSSLAERDPEDRPSAEPFAIRAGRQAPPRRVKRFHAARHAEG